MSKAFPYKTKQFLLVLIKIGLVVAAFYFIYSKLFDNPDLHFDEFLQIIVNFSSFSSISVLFLVFLSILNWFFEILKWKNLVSHISEISFIDAATESLGALTASLITPNRIGDYGAKAMYHPSQSRTKIMWLNLVGNSLQMLTTSIFGSIGLVYFAIRFESYLNLERLVIWLAIAVISIVIFTFLLNQKWFISWKTSLLNTVSFVRSIQRKIVWTTFVFSLLRYLIFSFQFYYLLVIFGVDLSYFEAMIIISTMYFLSSIMPSIFIFDVLIKGGLAVYLFGLIGVPEYIILVIVSIMWILNFVLPSIIGSYHVLKFQLPKTVS